MRPLDVSIAEQLGAPLLFSRPVAGGCIHEARRLDLKDGRTVFVKSSENGRVALLESELYGLELLAPHIQVPRVLLDGTYEDGTRWIAMEWLSLHGLGEKSWENFGRQLRKLHAVTGDRYGLEHDNFIGTTPQFNAPSDSWAAFFVHQRIEPQLRLARSEQRGLPENEILQRVEDALAGHTPPPALLHGDLWSGNVAALDDESAVVFDPAVYFGDPETDLAMLELFGGPLPPVFFKGYGETPYREKRRAVYDLYHALNHLNLFGSGYAAMVEGCLQRLRGQAP